MGVFTPYLGRMSHNVNYVNFALAAVKALQKCWFSSACLGT